MEMCNMLAEVPGQRQPGRCSSNMLLSVLRSPGQHGSAASHSLPQQFANMILVQFTLQSARQPQQHAGEEQERLPSTSL